MRSKWLLSLLVLTLISMSNLSAEAGMFNDVGRFLGWGASNGYHAYNGCDWYGPAYYGGNSPKPCPAYRQYHGGPSSRPTLVPSSGRHGWRYQPQQISPR